MKPRIRIKYCGGCNPQYDRVAVVEEMKARLGASVEWVGSDADPCDRVVAVQGCDTACADLAGFEGCEILQITGPDDLGPLLERMRSSG